MKALIPVGLAVLLTTAATTAEAVPVLDQSNPASGGESFNDSLEQQQQVTDGIAGTLAGIELFALPGHSDTVTVKVGVGSGFYSGPFAFTASALLTSGGTFIDTSAADIALTVGEHFVIDVSGGTDITGSLPYTIAGSTSPYPGGDEWAVIGSPFDETTLNNVSIAFETFITPNAITRVPESGTLGLFAVGVAVLAGQRRARRWGRQERNQNFVACFLV